VQLKNIPDIENTIENTISLIEEIHPPLIEEIYKVVIDNELENIISQKQYKYLINTKKLKVSSIPTAA
jgi:hypothetical protein